VLAALSLAAVGLFALKSMKRDLSHMHYIPFEVTTAFSTWRMAENKIYGSPSEEYHRLRVFYMNYNKVKYSKDTGATYELALNKFADLSEAEFVAKYTGLKIPEKSIKKAHPIVREAAIPTNVDWRTSGAVNPVKNQGSCGSCWAFSAIGALESAAVINGGWALKSLSEQQLVDCAGAEGNQGCEGGWMSSAFEYIQKAGGIEQESDYPYTAKDDKCASNPALFTGIQITKYTDLAENDCTGLLNTLAQQPVAVAVAANAFQLYSKGVFSTKFCGTGLNHGVVAIGYGHDDSSDKDFWLLRNSWGTGWGEAGYIRLDRSVQTKTGMCGVCMVASYALSNSKQ